MNKNESLEEKCKVFKENEISNLNKIASLEDYCRSLQQNESTNLHKINSLEENFKVLKDNESANLVKIAKLEENCKLLKENETKNLLIINSLEENYKVLSLTENQNKDKLKNLEENIKKNESNYEDLKERNKVLSKEKEEFQHKYNEIKGKLDDYSKKSNDLSISNQINILNIDSSNIGNKQILEDTIKSNKERVDFQNNELQGKKTVSPQKEKSTIMAKLEKKNSLIKEKKDNSILISNLELKPSVEIKSPTAERNLVRKDSGKSLQLPIPSISIAIPQEDEEKDRSKVMSSNNLPTFPYQLCIQESEPQDCNPTHTYFVKSGVASRRPSNKSEAKLNNQKKKLDSENEVEKMITERMKAGEDFEAIFNEMNINSHK